MYISEIVMNTGPDRSSYLCKLPVVRHLMSESIRLDSPVSVFVGENGTGKSTLLEAVAIAYGFNPEGGTRNFNFSTKDTHSELYRHLSLTKRAFPNDGFFLRAESLYNVATNIDQIHVVNSYGGVSLHEQSHGESFLSIVQNRFTGGGLYIIDEPEAALSPMKLLTLIVEIDRLVKDSSQFIIATHSPMLMAIPGAQVFQLSENGIDRVDYRDTEHFRVMKDFINDPGRMLHYLLD